MKSNDTVRLERRRTVMKMEPARLEPSCETTEASAAISGFQRRPGKAGNLWKTNLMGFGKFGDYLTVYLFIFVDPNAYGVLFLGAVEIIYSSFENYGIFSTALSLILVVTLCVLFHRFDSVHLYYLFPSLEEGGLATYRTAIVQNQHLAMLAKVSTSHNKSSLHRSKQ